MKELKSFLHKIEQIPTELYNSKEKKNLLDSVNFIKVKFFKFFNEIDDSQFDNPRFIGQLKSIIDALVSG